MQGSKALLIILVSSMLFPYGCKKAQVNDKENVANKTDTIGKETRNESHTIEKDKGFYKTITIGTQEWMVENLYVDHYRNGDLIPEIRDFNVWDTIRTGAWCYYYNDSARGKIYGKLYNWYAVNDPRGLEPEGWHIPSISEWMKLAYFLGGKEVAGGKTKAPSFWKNPNTGGTNESGFTALPGGIRVYKGFNFLYESGFFWSSVALSDDIGPLYIYLGYDYSNICRGRAQTNYGMSIRCIKDCQDNKENQEVKDNHKYTKHSNFNVFWKDFQKVVYKRDKKAVLKMTHIPFIDKNRDIYDEASGSSCSLTSLSKEEFLDNYDNIFKIDVIKTINTAKFKALGIPKYENYATKGPGIYRLSKDAYLLEVECMEPHLFIFEKKEGVFKLTCVPYQE